MTSVRQLFGLEPDKFSGTLLNINAGSVAEYYGTALYDFPTQTQIDLAKQGAWGLDVLPVGTGDLYVYLIVHDDGTPVLMASQQKFMGEVTVPVNYSIRRKLPFGVKYNPVWGGIPNFHLTHWPMPTITYTDAEYGSTWTPLAAGAATTWTDVDLSPWVPDNSRLVHLVAEVRYAAGIAGSGYIRSSGAQTVGKFAGSASPGSPFSSTTHSLRVTSALKIQYRVTGTGARLYLYVSGYDMTEPA